MKGAATWLETIDRILNSINQECEWLDLHMEQINNVPAEQAEELVAKAKAISHRLHGFERLLRDHIGLAVTNPSRGRQRRRERRN
jgi:hypothetical protein